MISEAPSADIRTRLIQAALEAFCEEGYRASCDRIAARAGVAKQTLYNHFASKDELFAAITQLGTESVSLTLDHGAGDVRECLLRFSALFHERVLGETGLAVYRTLIAERPRFPALGKAFFEGGPQTMVRLLSAFLAKVMERGLLRRDDPDFAAEMLLSLLGGFERTRRLLSPAAFTPAEETERITRTVDCFLRAYAPEGTAS